MYVWLSIDGHVEQWERPWIFRQRHDIVNAIEAGDGDAAAQAVVDHMAGAATVLVN